MYSFVVQITGLHFSDNIIPADVARNLFSGHFLYFVNRAKQV
jgi:hypothetical protein